MDERHTPSVDTAAGADPRAGGEARVVGAYDARADEYAAVLGSMDAVHPEDRRLVEDWAALHSGTLLDAGCGPGHWSAHLARRGHAVIALDPVERFVSIARAAAPEVDVRRGAMESTGLPHGSISGVLSWYSLVHHDPDRVTVALAEFRRVLAPGGGLLVGCFEGPVLEPFDHAVTTAYRWPTDRLAAVLERAGFTVDAEHRRTDRGARPHAALVARRR
ncbi:class I SAM-dependent methyltransferase [Curtobacterium caseinilyticum]|uniref:Class I SAM-dependent methyltransferase n=1 Tax=Curtobacterium caseinilyticum TaxID=3055137 RepID=A0ABT7TNP8_9MICO|nr:class I SAM-dependent methyltransferase [Curtobacterium caseinilyticum]MDM7891217.1 class I SAM-dependent methyltransferase [Curtobacterium caseinilyticum]